MNFVKKFLLISLFLSNSFLYADSKIINFDQLTNKINNSDKHIVVFFHMNYCPYCIRIKKFTLKNEDIKKMINKDFIFVDINTDKQNKIIFDNRTFSTNEFVHYFDINLFPTILFLDQEKEVVYTARGYRKATKFKKILHFIKTKSYENYDFFDYERKNIEKE